jgi:undecaprenyl-phosphate 4-deoxy-4-formamido-L-arabinose transferase
MQQNGYPAQILFLVVDDNILRMKKINYSVVVPVFNSETALSDLTNQIADVFTAMQCTWELIFVDDHSSDGSWKTILSLKSEYPDHVKGYHFARNFGQHNATLCGLNKAKGEFIITMDDDLQHSPSDIHFLIEKQKESDFELVYGVFAKKKQHFFRKIQSRFLKWLGKTINDSPGDGSSFRLMTKRLAKSVSDFQMRFVYLDDMFYWHTDLIGFTDVTHHPSIYRKSGYTNKTLAGTLYNLFMFNTALPLKIMTYGGLLISIFTALAGIWFILRKILYDVPIGYTSTIVTILFSTSIIIFSLGVIGEYLRRMYLGQTGQPAYSVDNDTEDKAQDEDQ